MSELWNWGSHQISWKLENQVNDSRIATVLIHGFGASKEHWRFNQKSISELAPCYSLDLLGFGESSQPIAQLLYEKNISGSFHYCFDQWSKQVSDFCNEIVQKPVILIGNSIGAVIAINAIKGLKNECAGAVLIDCAQRTMDDKRLPEQSLLMRFLRPVIKTFVRQRFLSESLFRNAANPTFIEKILKVAYPSGKNINQELIDILYRPTQRKGAPEAFRGFINLFDDHLAPELLKNIESPIYLIWGEKDPWEPLEEAREWLNSFSCVKSLDIIPNAGHCPHDEMPNIVNPILVKIIQDVEL